MNKVNNMYKMNNINKVNNRHNLLLDMDRVTLRQVLREIKRLQHKFPELSDAVVDESRDPEWYRHVLVPSIRVRLSSYHISFLKDSLSWERLAEILRDSKAHRGFKYYSLLVCDQTLRRFEKPDGTPAPRYLFTVKKGGEIVHEA